MIAALRHECVYGEACHSGHHFDCRLEFLQRNDIKHQYVGDAYFPKVNAIYPRFVPYCYQFSSSAASQYFTFSEIATSNQWQIGWSASIFSVGGGAD